MRLLRKPKKEGLVKNVRKVVHNGIIYDSRLEYFCAQQLSLNKIPYDFKPTYTLIDKFNYMGENIRSMTLTPDFRLPEHGYIVDPKGLVQEVNNIKFKLLKHHLKENNESYKIVFLRNQSEVVNFINCLKTNTTYIPPKKKKK